MNMQLTPARLLETATAFWPAKVLLSGVELGLFTRLAKAPLDNAGLASALGILPSRSADVFDSLVAMGFLERDGVSEVHQAFLYQNDSNGSASSTSGRRYLLTKGF